MSSLASAKGPSVCVSLPSGRPRHPNALRARQKSFTGEHDASLDQFIVVTVHGTRRHFLCNTGFGLGCFLDHHHHSHMAASSLFGFYLTIE